MEREAALVVGLARLDGRPGSGPGRAVAADLDPGHGLAGVAVDHDAAQRAALDDGQVGRRVGAGPHAHALDGPRPWRRGARAPSGAAGYRPPAPARRGGTGPGRRTSVSPHPPTMRRAMLDELGAEDRAGDRPAGRRVDHPAGDPAGRLEDRGLEGPGVGPYADRWPDIPRVRRLEAGHAPRGAAASRIARPGR